MFIDLQTLLQMEKSVHGKLRVLFVNGWAERSSGSDSPREAALLHKVAIALKAHLGQLRGDPNDNTFAVYIDKCSLSPLLQELSLKAAQSRMAEPRRTSKDDCDDAKATERADASGDEEWRPSERDNALLKCVARLTKAIRRHPHVPKLNL